MHQGGDVNAEARGATTPAAERSGIGLRPLLVLFYLSGAAALVYQVLWLKQLTRLFGVSAHATSVTLAIFFLGLAAGGWVWGRRAARIRRPLRAYAWLEVGVGVSALLFFGLFDLFAAVQAPLFATFDYDPTASAVLKFALAFVILFPAAFFMGGTLPVMAQFLVRRREDLGRRTTLLYSVNTMGAATGALLAGFVLPRLLGLNGAYALAIGIDLFVALVTGWWSRREVLTAPEAEAAPGREAVSVDSGDDALTVRALWALAAFSGFSTLALEVLWTRMLSQVLQNSVYTFATILTVFLVGLSLGAAVAHRLCERARSSRRTLVDLLTVSAVVVAVTPWIYRAIAEDLQFWNSDLAFWAYIALAFAGIAVTIGPAVLVMGAIFPFLMKVAEPRMVSAGRTVGDLAAINTVLAIAGSLAAGFVLLGTFGVWTSIVLVVAGYLVAAALVAPSGSRRRRLNAVAAIVACAVAFGPGIDPSRPGFADAESETIVETWQGPDAMVSVTEDPEGALRLRINSSYNLGSSASAVNERLQGQLPALLHPDPRSALFIGLGTGITASGAMHFPFERVTVCEVNREVVVAAREHFGPWLEGLFERPGVRVVPEDGRIWLSTRDETYDVIVADIFLSYKAGVASLYTREHFETVRERLADGGVFVQWFAAFDTSEREFEILARTMLDVFPSVTLWRRSFSTVFPVYAFVATNHERPLDVERIENGLRDLVAAGHLDERLWLPNIPLAAYVANLDPLRERFADAPLNTDDRTILEYTAPMTERDAKGAGVRDVLAWGPLLRFCEQLHESVPPENDPHLVNATPAQRRQVRAGTAYYGYEVMRRTGREADATAYRRLYERLISP